MVRNKPSIPYEQEVINQLNDELPAVSNYISDYGIEHLKYVMHFSTYNCKTTDFMIYGCVYGNKAKNSERTPVISYFIGIVKDGFDLITMVPTNPYNCKEELIEFKKANNWY